MENKNIQEQTPTQSKAQSRIIIISMAVIILLLAILLWRFSRPAPTESNDPAISWDADSEEGGLATSDPEKIQEELNQKVQEGMINISMNTNPVFANGAAKGDLMICNIEQNNYPQVVYIIRKDTGEEIYRSGAIPVGSKIEKAKLSVDLDKGEYDCIAYFNNVNMDTGSILGTAGAEIKITVSA